MAHAIASHAISLSITIGVLLGSSVDAQGLPLNASDCWIGDVNAEICCDLNRGLRGNEQCWDGTFTFEACCPDEAARVDAEFEQSCWPSGMSDPLRTYCCDFRKGSTGDAACWNAPFTFEACCREEAMFVRSAPQRECWTGGVSAEICCDLARGPQGEPSCWEPPSLYTFDLCCPEAKAKAAKAIEDSCWFGSVTPEFCCDLRKGARGDTRCWSGQYVYESCCTADTYAALEVAATQRTCWSGAFNSRTCCDVQKSPRGDLACWSPPYNFPICCPEEMKLSTEFEKRCWVGGMSPAMCCDVTKGPKGNEACWEGLYTFDNCCPDLAAAAMLQSLSALPPPPAPAPTPAATPMPPPPPQETKLSAEPQIECWVDGMSPSFCCDMQKGPKGNEECWEGLYTFENCCVAGAAAAAAALQAASAAAEQQNVSPPPTPLPLPPQPAPPQPALNCWSGGFDAAFCCDQTKGPQGDPTCWGGAFTFETCCHSAAM